MKVLAISAGTSDSSASTRLAKKIGEATAGEVEIVGLKPFARDIADAITHGFPSAHLDELFARAERADAIVAVAPIYNAMPSGLFVSFFDVLPEELLDGKPVALGATGGSPRHSLVIEQAMRPMFVYMHAMVPTTAVYAATEDWGAPGEGFEGSSGRTLSARIHREGQQLAHFAAIASGIHVGLALVAGEVASEQPLAEAEERSRQAARSPESPLDSAPEAQRAHKSAEAAAIDEFPDFVSFDQLLQ